VCCGNSGSKHKCDSQSVIDLLLPPLTHIRDQPLFGYSSGNSMATMKTDVITAIEYTH